MRAPLCAMLILFSACASRTAIVGANVIPMDREAVLPVKLTKALHDAGVPILTGTDAATFGVFPGAGVHEELRELVDAGLRPWDALAASTVNAGKFVSVHVPRAEPFGVVAEGYRADLVLVAANPLEDIGNVSLIEGVMAGGVWVGEDAPDLPSGSSR